MESTRKNNQSLYLDNEFLATLALAKEGILHPVDKLMNQAECLEVEQSGYYKGKPFPFPFIIAPAGEKNKETLTHTQKGDTLDLIVDGKIRGFLVVEEVFEVDKKRRIEQIFGTYDLSNPEIQSFLKRLGDYAVCGDYEVWFDDIKQIKTTIQEAKKELDAKNVAAIMINANPFHRAHERVIRMTLEKYDLLVIFLLKPYKQDILSYDLRLKSLQYFVDNYLPKNRVVIVPFENTYLFSSYKNAILDSICASNYGCNKLILGQHHSGIGAYYDKNEMKSVVNQYNDLDIEIEIIAEFVYCDECKTLVSTSTCPHGAHHHIKYHAKSLLEILKLGMLPPAIFMRKDISAMLLSELFKHRFDNISKIYDAIFPNNGLLESHDEKDFYLELMRLHQTTSLT